MVGRSVGRRGVGRRRALLDRGRRTVESFYFFLELSVSLNYLFFYGTFKYQRKHFCELGAYRKVVCN